MSTTSYKIASDLFLVWETAPVTKTPAAPKPKPTNHVVVIDVSGSMSYELPKLRTQLKDKLVHLLRDDDTVSIIWFSGRGEFGVLTEAAPVVGVKDLSKLHQAIDRWLRPVGMTGFREPLEEVAALVKRVKNGNPFSLFFMSDGCDNQWSRAQILDAVKTAAAGLAAATFVEYGYYADRAMLTAMATKAGGAHIFAQDFNEYEPVFAAAMQRQAVGDPTVALAIKGDPIGGFAFTLDRGPSTDPGLYTTITTYKKTSKTIT
jgi:secreted protein with Ig-like and vWFA domain